MAVTKVEAAGRSGGYKGRSENGEDDGYKGGRSGRGYKGRGSGGGYKGGGGGYKGRKRDDEGERPGGAFKRFAKPVRKKRSERRDD
ncbi:MAG: hypothetical protein P1U82_06675 [Verrucomicrobiales bacterium]|nr:hypothetical protein [Verrucomicrobiales bacterium]